MRDAALHEKLPNIQDLERPEYFPYRWGHSFWAFVGAKFGDRTVASLVDRRQIHDSTWLGWRASSGPIRTR